MAQARLAEETKKIARLKAIGQRVNKSKKEFLEAIDKFQDRHMQLKELSP